MKEVAKDVYHLPLLPRNSVNCYIIEGILIDSGIKGAQKKLTKALRNTSLTAHVLTHAHADHQGCTKAICETFNLPLYCHEKEVARAESGFATKDYPSNKHFIARLQQAYWAGKGHPVNGILKENDQIGNFSVIETPGHSAGHLSFFRPKDGVLILGDVATNMHLLTTRTGLHLPPNIFTSNQRENIQSLVKLAKLHPRIICFGHGPVLDNQNKTFEAFVSKALASSPL